VNKDDWGGICCYHNPRPGRHSFFSKNA